MPELLLTDEATSTELLSAAEEVGRGADVSYYERSPVDGGEIEPTRAPSLWTRLSQGLLGHGLLSVCDQAIVSGTSFLTSVLVGRAGGQSTLGWFALAISLVSLARAIQEQLVSAPYMVFSQRQTGPRIARYTGNCLAMQTGLSLLTLVGLGMLGGLVYTGWSPRGLGTILPGLAIAVPFLLLREHLRQTSFAALKPFSAVGLDLGATALQFAGLALIALFGELTPNSVLLVMGLACAVSCSIWLIRRPQPLELQPAELVADWRLNWQLGRWALAGHLVGSTAPYIMPWLVLAFHNERIAGLLAAANTLAGLANLFVQGMANFLTPQTSRAYQRGGPRELTRVVLHVVTAMTLALGSVCLVSWLFSGPLVTAVYGASYAPAAVGMSLLVTATLVNSWGMIAGNALWAMDRPRANFTADLCALVVTLSTAALLIGPWGGSGAAAATLAGVTVGTIVRVSTLICCLKQELSAERSPVSYTLAEGRS